MWFELVGCYRFCKKLQGYNDQVSQDFAKNYDGEKAQLDFLLLYVNENTIVEVTEMPTEGERWFKKKPAQDLDCNRFLKEEHQNCDWTKSVPRSYIKREWNELLILIQRYITGEGRYNSTSLYHIRLLENLTGEKPLNLHYFL